MQSLITSTSSSGRQKASQSTSTTSNSSLWRGAKLFAKRSVPHDERVADIEKMQKGAGSLPKRKMDSKNTPDCGAAFETNGQHVTCELSTGHRGSHVSPSAGVRWR